MIELKKQTGTQWTDEKGLQVEVKRVTTLEKAKESHAYKIAIKAVAIEKSLTELKVMVDAAISAMQKELSKEAGSEVDLRGHTFYNFDRSIKIFREVAPEVEYDEGMMQAAYTLFEEYINGCLFAPEHELVKSIILSAFKTIRGKFDNRKINSLIQQKENESVKDNEQFQHAIELVLKARKVVNEKSYDRVFLRDENGEYIQVNLNFSGLGS
jgi:hypothetical protein